LIFLSFFTNDPSTTLIYTLSLHDALPISKYGFTSRVSLVSAQIRLSELNAVEGEIVDIETLKQAGLISSVIKRAKIFASGEVKRSEEHTSELQSRENLVCRLLLEKKKKIK